MTHDEILNLLLTKSINTHYAQRYMKFIKWCSSKTRTTEYLEEHHILPKAKSVFPEYKSFKDYPWNKIQLTGQEHFIAHWLLWKALGKFMAYAFSSMKLKSKYQQDRHYKINGKVYEQLRIDVSDAQSKRVISEETHTKMSLAQSNRPKIECPHCHKTTNPLNFKRWHGDNCKIVTGKAKHDNKSNQTLVECPHCNKVGKIGGMYSNHFDNCSLVKDKKNKDRIVCPHCNTEMANTKDKILNHFDNCPTLTGITKPQSEKSKAANSRRGKIGVPKQKINCPYCDKIGTPKRMYLNHFDNCEFKSL